jgi:hypothetical protein
MAQSIRRQRQGFVGAHASHAPTLAGDGGTVPGDGSDFSKQQRIVRQSRGR